MSNKETKFKIVLLNKELFLKISLPTNKARTASVVRRGFFAKKFLRFRAFNPQSLSKLKNVSFLLSAPKAYPFPSSTAGLTGEEAMELGAGPCRRRRRGRCAGAGGCSAARIPFLSRPPSRSSSPCVPTAASCSTSAAGWSCC